MQNNYTKKLIENLDNSLEVVIILTNTLNFILLYINFNLFNYHRCHLNHPILYNDHTFMISNLGTAVCNNFLSSFEFLFRFFYLRQVTMQGN